VPFVPNGSFESGVVGTVPDGWTAVGWAHQACSLNGNPEVSGHGNCYIDLLGASATSGWIPISGGTTYTLTARAHVMGRPLTFTITYGNPNPLVYGLTPAVFTMYQNTSDFVTFPMRFTAPIGATEMTITIQTPAHAAVDDLH
jgi:hypothetical protein